MSAQGEAAPDPEWDTVGWFIATTHQLLGHDMAAAVMGVPAYDRADCLICAFERDPTDENKAAVMLALSAVKVDDDG
jgi:hypothetical protein